VVLFVFPWPVLVFPSVGAYTRECVGLIEECCFKCFTMTVPRSKHSDFYAVEFNARLAIYDDFFSFS
jgi:hypothetical protein